MGTGLAKVASGARRRGRREKRIFVFCGLLCLRRGIRGEEKVLDVEITREMDISKPGKKLMRAGDCN